MGGVDVLVPGEVGDGAGQFEDAVVGAGAEVHLADGGLHQVFAGLIDLAVALDLGGTHVAVDDDVGLVLLGEAGLLAGAGPFYAAADVGGRLARFEAGELLEGDAGYVDVEVDAVEEGAADAALVALNGRHGAGAGFAFVAVEAAGTGVHGGHEHEVGGEGEGAGGAADGDDFVFEGLAQAFEVFGTELGQLVEEEDAAVGEADLAGAGHGSAADQAGVADGVMGGAERAGADEGAGAVELAGDRVDAGDFEGLGQGGCRQDRRQGAGHEGFAAAGRAGETHIVAAGAGDFQGAFGVLLAANVLKVDGVDDLFTGCERRRALGRNLLPAGEMGDEIAEMPDREDVDAFDERGFGCVGLGDEEAR